MPVSANTLFHFTRERENLIGIIEHGFYPSYSLEDLSAILPPDRLTAVHVPMVCFCDILLSQIGKHIEYYGEYGIGLRKKEWGIPRGISPIVYVDDNSRTAALMRRVVEDVVKASLPKDAPLKEQLLDFCKYMKAYEGLVRNRTTGKMENRRFYDEREWRYSPPNAHAWPSERPTEVVLRKANKDLRAHGLKFEAADVKYIIVSKESEIPAIIRSINRSRDIPTKAKALLSSKVISVEQIKEDM